MSEVSHAMPQSLKRLGKGEYAVKGTELRIVQGEDGKWKVEGHSDNLGAFKNRQGALAKLEELGLVPAVQAEPAKQVQPEAKEQPKARPTTRKAKETAKASA
jgi:hypothetical protein